MDIPFFNTALDLANRYFLDYFHNPEWLLLLLLIPLLALLRGRKGKNAAVLFSSTAIARKVAQQSHFLGGSFLFSLRLLILAALIVGLARPQQPHGHSEIEASGIDIVLAVDVSSSMLALDLSEGNEYKTRLDVAKDVIQEFIEKRPTDRIGVIAFAGNPYLVSPLTLNHDWLESNLARLRVGLIEDGTAIGSAIGMSVNRLKNITAKSRIVILLTDGSNNAGKLTPIVAAEVAASFDTKVYTIGVGGDEDQPLPQIDPDTGELILRRGMPQRSFSNGRQMMAGPVEEGPLKEVAKITSAQYFRARDKDELESIYDAIDELEKTEVKLRHFATFDELFFWFVGAGLALLGIEQILAHTRLRRLP